MFVYRVRPYSWRYPDFAEEQVIYDEYVKSHYPVRYRLYKAVGKTFKPKDYTWAEHWNQACLVLDYTYNYPVHGVDF